MAYRFASSKFTRVDRPVIGLQHELSQVSLDSSLVGHSSPVWSKKMRFRNLGPVLGFCAVCACLIVCVASFAAQSSPGVTENEILIGSCSALEGPSKSLGTETVAG